MNTVACQITAYADSSVADAGPTGDGPTLFEWMKDRGDPVEENDYISRASHGRYLAAAIERCCENAPQNVEIVKHHAQARDLNAVPGGKEIVLNTGVTLVAQKVLLTTGNVGDQQPRSCPIANLLPGESVDAYIENPYPVERLEAMVPRTDVGVIGLGLTSIDVIMSLTIGRGGSFQRGQSGNLRYLASGREPTIHAWSRTGMPLATRAANQKGSTGQYRPRLLTEEMIDHLTSQKGKLDFKRDIEPLLIGDMAVAFYEVACGSTQADEVASRLEAGEPLEEVVAAQPYREKFSWASLVEPPLLSGDDYQDGPDFQTRWTAWLEADIEEARLGNATSPWKGCCDALRDLRDALRHAVEFDSLTAASQRYVAHEFTPINNRLAVGPPVHRAEEILSLVEAGILRIDWGPGPSARYDKKSGKIVLRSTRLAKPQEQILDVVIDGRVVPEQSELIRRLVLRRMARLATNSDATGTYPLRTIEVTRKGYVVNGYGTADKSVCASGQIAEGTVWYPQVAARYGVNSRSFRDAGSFGLDAREAIKHTEQRRTDHDGSTVDVS